jgi:hypothetical protein
MNCVGCPADKVYALHNQDGSAVRFSFSKSLLAYLRKQYNPTGSVQRHTLILGKELDPGTSTNACLFAVCDRRKGTILRVQLCRTYAENLVDSSRYLAEAWIKGKKKCSHSHNQSQNQK